MRSTIFLSYSRKNAFEKTEMIKQLGVLEAAGLIDLWNDEKIPPGADWFNEIESSLGLAKIAVLLITADYLTSNFVLSQEIPRILLRHQNGGLIIYPVICRACAWKAVSWLARLQVRPKNGTPIWGRTEADADTELAEIALELADIVGNQLIQRSRDSDQSYAENEIAPILAVQKDFSLGEIDKAIRWAISTGAPLYNNGRHSECAGVYYKMSHALRRRLEDVIAERSGPVSMTEHYITFNAMPDLTQLLTDNDLTGKREHDTMLYEIIDNELTFGMSMGDDLKRDDARKIAWEIRHCFNRIIKFIGTIRKIDEGFLRLQNGVSDADLAGQLRSSVRFVVNICHEIYNEGVMTKEARNTAVLTAAGLCLYLVTRCKQEMSTHGVDYVSDVWWNWLSSALAVDIKEHNEAYRIVWNFSHFDHLLRSKTFGQS